MAVVHQQPIHRTEPSPLHLLDGAGQPVRIGPPIARGGEGVVYEVAGRTDVVVKVYHQPPKGEQAEKLAAVAGMSASSLSTVAAWPFGTIHSPGREVVGLSMPWVAGQPIHELYSPAERKRRFPDKDWQFLIRTARNCSVGVNAIHEAGVVIGDVNQNNFLVADNAQVRLIDCDSFQVAGRGRVFRCPVGVPEYTPPELQGSSFRTFDRSPNHDRFGLAVLVFHLLFMGRHPFAGRYAGKGDMPLERTIREYRYAFSADAGRLLMQPPPRSLSVAAATPDLAPLFERAFTAGSERPSARPTAREWHDALGRLEQALTGCQINPGHLYPKHLPGCMWCDLVRHGAPDVFPTVAGARATATKWPKATTINVTAVWAEIKRIRQTPLPNYVRPPVPLGINPAALPRTVLDAHQQATQSVWRHLRRVFDPGYGELRNLPEYKQEAARRQTALRLALVALDNAERQRQNMASTYSTALAKKVSELRRTRNELRQLNATRATEQAALQQKAQADQLNRSLSRRLLTQAKLKNIGPGRLATLRSYGIETAADATLPGLATVPGFGKTLTKTLIDWRTACEQKYRPSSKASVPTADLAALDQRLAIRFQQLAAALLKGRQELEAVVTAANFDLHQQDRTISSVLLPAYAQAEADTRLMPV